MLQEVSPEQFDEWLAFDRIEPDPLERIRVILKFGLSAIAQHIPVKPEDLDPVNIEKTEAPNTHTPEQALAAIRFAYGK